MKHHLLAIAAVLVLYACGTRPPTRATAPVAPAPAENHTRPTAPATPAETSAPTQSGPKLPSSVGIAERSDVRGFMAEMSRKHGFSQAELRSTFEGAGIHSGILEAMAKPHEAKPWHAYRKLFLTEKRISGGREFMTQNAEALGRASARFGVSPDIVTAIIGIESSYGHRPGNYRVIDSLSTLAFEYPRRAGFFRSELEQFLLLCREEGMDPLQPLGSYAGAMGMPQFMPSSFRKLAADGDGDGHRDIWNNPADAIASVARYFAVSGWRTGQPIAVPAAADGAEAYATAGKNPKPSRTLDEWAALGVRTTERLSGGLKGALVTLEGETGPDYWIVFPNFSVIMRYNHSPLYAMAAYEVSRELSN